jgi:hypothetical protein
MSKSDGDLKGLPASKLAVKSLSNYKSKVEDAILKSKHNPICINETAKISANGEKGIWANRCETCAFRGSVPISQYPINQDSNPLVIRKKTKKVNQVQPVYIRYLKPPTPPEPGPIIIRQAPNKPTAPAPPMVIRQAPLEPATQAPLVNSFFTGIELYKIINLF